MLVAVSPMLFLTAVVLLCDLGDAEQLLVVVDLRRQLKDLFKNFLVTVWSLELAQLQGPVVQCIQERIGEGEMEYYCSVKTIEVQTKQTRTPP